MMNIGPGRSGEGTIEDLPRFITYPTVHARVFLRPLQVYSMSRAPLRIKKPRCSLVYALAPDGVSAGDANRIYNEFVADRSLPLVLFHDHFIGDPGGLAVFYAEAEEERRALFGQQHLVGWRVEIQPLIFARSPAAPLCS